MPRKIKPKRNGGGDYQQSTPIPIKISREKIKHEELGWNEREEKELIARIRSLRDDQIAALFGLVGIKFDNKDLGGVVEEIRESIPDSAHLGILLDEADSKENLLWWVEFFEKHK